ncbi:asparagine synthase (glutamine-hydrolyzing) [Mucilaginibacter ginsenosidivorax]|uniref:asparagine synthase (glutamine-hydrolyzing) n=1 Tax=Mucilaginibacter ginsenosidivorax TaxID=862126 RepID=A0A5B8W4N0_9SPHI|nr:asparagine synthase (glutamine-hydrolyzing) [Mucilaginibacter ginsenosidivorax]QEC77935.1 asparagine synthase (glutamine-hydrolyzing) [Mucilaginibacter ginsenosidivorax]
MCRIAGVINNHLHPQLIRGQVKAMCQALQHGGPDDEGIFVDEKNNLVFGHRRLSIIDLSASGHQPMADVRQKIWITFNGEIYNYLELRNELLTLGVEFTSATDTEVIIAAYMQWGTDAFGRFRGMFAFALFDSIKKLTYLVRDTAGIKPLYYFIRPGQLSFASETRAFIAAGITTENEAAWPVRFLAFGHVPEPYTILKNVFSLAKGHYLCWNHASSTHVINTYKIAGQTKDQITDTYEAQHFIKQTLMNGVHRQLIADAPLGVFLSGGTDSSLITLLADKEKKEQLKTISIFFNEKSYDEQAYQRLVLDKVSGQNFPHLVQQQDFENHLPEIISAMDMPTTDGINSWFISKYAHEDGLKAVLSGVGADEYFGGYPSFNRIRYIRHLKKIPPFLFSAAHGLLPDPYKKLTFLANKHPIADYLLLRGLFSPGDIARTLDMGENEVRDILFNGINVPENYNYDAKQASWFETNLYMQNQLLRDTDVMSMNHGLEVRVPFLDEDFTNLAERISPSIRFSQQQAKKVLIDSFSDLLPQAVWNRPKMGFSFPLQRWMGEYNPISDSALYKGKLAQNTIKKFKNNQIHWSKAFALYQIQPYV